MSSINFISSRPSQEQVIALIEFMKKNPDLAFGRLKNASKRAESKKLWFKLTRILNGMVGPTRPMKSWIKYWADKKAHVKNKIQGTIGATKPLLTNVEQTIWDHFLADDTDNLTKKRSSLNRQNNKDDDTIHYYEESGTNEVSYENNSTNLEFEVHPVEDFDERHMDVMERLVKIMEEQTTALTKVAQSSEINFIAMERLAEASLAQARAFDRLANSLTNVSSCTQDVRNAVVGVDNSMKRFYSNAST